MSSNPNWTPVLSVKNNKFLLVDDSVVVSQLMVGVIVELDKDFEAANHVATIGSGIRTESKQLTIIRNYAIAERIHQEFPAILTCTVDDILQYENEPVFAWQPSWCRLLQKGYKIDPIRPAVVLFDYIGSSGKNLRGHELEASKHIVPDAKVEEYCAFDVRGGANGLEDEAKIIGSVFESARIPELVAFKPEPKQNTIHCDVRRKT